jgi:hypothetical protein
MDYREVNHNRRLYGNNQTVYNLLPYGVLSALVARERHSSGPVADPAVPRLFIIDGSKALAKAIRRSFGRHTPIQRCQIQNADFRIMPRAG